MEKELVLLLVLVHDWLVALLPGLWGSSSHDMKATAWQAVRFKAAEKQREGH